MAKKRKPIDPKDVPGWLSDLLRCPQCGEGLVLARDAGCVCIAVPAHTGTIRQTDWEEKIRYEHSLRLARNENVPPIDKVLVMARRYLDNNHKWKANR